MRTDVVIRGVKRSRKPIIMYAQEKTQFINGLRTFS